MNNSPTTAYVLASVIALIVGVGAYAIGLFNATLELNEKGYYIIVLLYGLFSVISLQKTIRDRNEDIKTSGIYYVLCWASSGIAIALLSVGLYNAEMLLSEKGFYAMAFVLSLFAAITVQKNVRDKLSIESMTLENMTLENMSTKSSENDKAVTTPASHSDFAKE